MNLTTGEVVGVASYSETRRIEVEESGDKAAKPSGTETEATKKVEKRWFGYRVDSVTKWEAIDLEKLNAQSERVEKFHELSDALVDVLKMNFNDARRHPRLNATIFAFEARLRAAGGGSLAAGTEVKDFFRVIRTLSEDGVNDLKNGDYYDYFRTCLYWEDNIPAQLEYRRDITDALRKYEANPTGFLSRMRGRN
jgi:serine protease Do